MNKHKKFLFLLVFLGANVARSYAGSYWITSSNYNYTSGAVGNGQEHVYAQLIQGTCNLTINSAMSVSTSQYGINETFSGSSQASWFQVNAAGNVIAQGRAPSNFVFYGDNTTRSYYGYLSLNLPALGSGCSGGSVLLSLSGTPAQ